MTISVTVKDIAQRADVSIGTVSRVFNNHQNVTADVRQRVLSAAADLGYSGSAGRRLAANAAGDAVQEIGFLFSPVNEGTVAAANPYWSQILAGVEQEARRTNLKLTYRSIGDMRASPAQLAEVVGAMQLHGLLLVGPVEEAAVRALQKTRLPLVLVAHYLPRLRVDTVLEDGFEGMLQAIEYLIAQGHRDIALIGGPQGASTATLNTMYTIERRLDAYRTALQRANIPFDLARYAASNLTPKGGYAACQRLLAGPSSFTALVCVNDSSALGAAQALREAGRSIPDDVSLVGFGDYLYSAEQLLPSLTTVHFDNVALGSIAVQRLLDRARNPQGARLTSLLMGELTIRGSVRPRQG